MLNGLFEKNKNAILKMAMEKYLEKDDKSLVAFKDGEGNPKCFIYKFDILKKMKELKDENFVLKEKIAKYERRTI